MKKVLMCASLLALSVSAFASDATGVYVRGDIGAVKEKLSKNTITSKKSSKVSPSYGVGVGYKFDDNFRSDVNLKLLNSKLRSNQKVKSKIAFVNGYYDFKNDSIFTPYVTAGVGIAKNTLKGTGITSKSKNSFAWNAGLGSKINMTSNIDLDVSYKYAALGKVKATQATDKANAKLRAHEVAVGAIYNF